MSTPVSYQQQYGQYPVVPTAMMVPAKKGVSMKKLLIGGAVCLTVLAALIGGLLYFVVGSANPSITLGAFDSSGFRFTIENTGSDSLLIQDSHAQVAIGNTIMCDKRFEAFSIPAKQSKILLAPLLKHHEGFSGMKDSEATKAVAVTTPTKVIHYTTGPGQYQYRIQMRT